jgi:hypothetical protein
MNQYGTENTYPNGYREPTTSAGSTADYGQTGQTSTGQARQGGKDEGVNLDSIANFAKTIQSKVKDVPYIVPLTAGGVGFAIGVLASSRILRQLCLIAGGFAVRYAIKNAPRDQIMNFAKQVVANTYKQAQAA